MPFVTIQRISFCWQKLPNMGPLRLTALLVLLLPCSCLAVSVVVSNGFEFHAVMTSPDVTFILVASNVSVAKGVAISLGLWAWHSSCCSCAVLLHVMQQQVSRPCSGMQ